MDTATGLLGEAPVSYYSRITGLCRCNKPVDHSPALLRYRTDSRLRLEEVDMRTVGKGKKQAQISAD